MSFYRFLFDRFLNLPDILLALFPIALLLAASVLFKIFKDRKKYIFLCVVIHIFFASLALSSYEASFGFFFLSLNILINVLLYFLTKIPLKKREKKNKVEDFTKQFLKDSVEEESFKADERAAGFEEDAAGSRPSAFPPRKILCGGSDMSDGEDVYKLSEEKVSLNHAIGVALQLKRAKLSVGDRLETDNIYKTLLLYRAKDELTKDEMSAMNGYLSTLLKLMAKYSL